MTAAETRRARQKRYAEQYRSPYKEVGLSSYAMTAFDRPIRRSPGSFATGLAANKTGHKWNISLAEIRRGREACQRCGQPRFAVEGLRCKGGKTWPAR